MLASVGNTKMCVGLVRTGWPWPHPSPGQPGRAGRRVRPWCRQERWHALTRFRRATGRRGKRGHRCWHARTPQRLLEAWLARLVELLLCAPPRVGLLHAVGVRSCDPPPAPAAPGVVGRRGLHTWQAANDSVELAAHQLGERGRL